MKLYMVPGAPNPTKVMLYIAEREVQGADLGIEQILVNPIKGEQRSPEHLARNPFGVLPVLELEDGTYLLESLSIINYLEDRFADGLLPSNLEQRAKARDLERVVELRAASPISRLVHAENSPLGLPKNPALAAEIESSLPPVFDYLKQQLADGRSYLTGEDVSLADITLESALQFARFREIDAIKGQPELQAWDGRYRARPAAQSVLKF